MPERFTSFIVPAAAARFQVSSNGTMESVMTAANCLSRWLLFVAQCNHRIHSRCPPRRNESRNQRHRDQQYDYADERNRIAGLHAEQ